MSILYKILARRYVFCESALVGQLHLTLLARGMTMNQKYLLCIPGEGFNDNLCQIETAWKYAEKHNRILVIHTDTNLSGLHDPFGFYFTTDHNNAVLKMDTELSQYLNDMPTYPPFVGGMIDAFYDDLGYSDTLMYYFPKYNQQVSFDFERNYDEPLLVHCQCGGGNFAHNCLKRLIFTEQTAAEIKNRLSRLPDEYDAIHIRNTDIATDYVNFFKKLYTHVKGKNVVICSDDLQCKLFAKSFFDKSSVFFLNEYDNNSEPVHFIIKETHDKNIVRKLNIMMLTDLIALSMSQKLHTSQGIVSRTGEPITSGFSQLAVKLYQNKNIIEHLFSGTAS